MRAVICLLSVLALAGCQSVRDNFGTPERNPGPCPNALSLYDAHRYVELRGEDVVYENVGFTGEILDVATQCRYTDVRPGPIDAELGLRMAFGRGPAADGDQHTYEYFVAVTRTDNAVIEREVYPVTVRFERGQDRVVVTETFDRIAIPRADATTSGANFEIIVGFVLSEEQIEFNRSGLRFRVDAGQD